MLRVTCANFIADKQSDDIDVTEAELWGEQLQAHVDEARESLHCCHWYCHSPI